MHGSYENNELGRYKTSHRPVEMVETIQYMAYKPYFMILEIFICRDHLSICACAGILLSNLAKRQIIAALDTLRYKENYIKYPVNVDNVE